MKCSVCGGLIIHEEAWGSYPARYKCSACGRDLPREKDAPEMALPARSNPRQPRGFYKKEKAENAKSLLLEGKGIREIARVTGLARGTVIRIKKYLNNHGNGGDEKMKSFGENKLCSECGKSMPINEFSKNHTTPDGFERFCKKCAKEKRKNYYKKQRHAKQGKKGKSRNYKHEYELRIKSKPRPASKNPDSPMPITDAITIDAQLIKAVKRSAVTEFIRKDLIPNLEKLIQERFA